MTENEFKKTLIDLISTDDYPEKNILLELLRISTIKFNKTSQYSKKEWNHCEEFIYVCIIPSKMKELDKHYHYLYQIISKIYPTNDCYDLCGVDIKPGIIQELNDISQTILFEDIGNEIIKEIRSAKYIIMISMAWFTDIVLYKELLNKKRQGLIIEIALNDCDENRNTGFSLENDFPVYWITVTSNYNNIMHEKFCVIDLCTAIHGSFNWTKVANYNKEQISIDKNTDTAKSFADEFMKLKNKRVWNYKN